MPFQKGNDGHGGGRPKYSGEWGAAIRDVLQETDRKTRQQNVRLLARKLVDKAKDGDVTALKEIGDRIDGKATQPVHHSGETAATVYIITGVPRDLEEETVADRQANGHAQPDR